MKDKTNLLELLREAIDDVEEDSFRLFEDECISETKHNFVMKRLFQTPKLRESREPIAYKIVGWILRHDFVIPKINRRHLRRFWYPMHHEAKTFGPDFRSGRFTSEEDRLLVRRLAWVLKRNGLEARHGLEMFDEIINLPRRQKSVMYTRLIVAAFIGGRKMLKYRRIFDVWKRLMSLRIKGPSQEMDNIKKYFSLNPEATVTDCQEDLMLKPAVFGSERINRVRKESLKEQVKDENPNDSVVHSVPRKTRVTDDVWMELLELVLKNQTTFDAAKVHFDDVDWSYLGDQMKRSGSSLRTLWLTKMAPVLALYHAGKDHTSVEWQRDFLESIKRSEAKERKEINWKAYTSEFPHQNTHSLRRMFDNLVAKRKGDATLKDAIDRVLERWDVAPRMLHMAKVHCQFATDLVDYYEHLRRNRIKEDDDRSLVRNYDDDC